MEESALLLFIPLRETKRLDPGISEKEDFFLVPFIPIPELAPLAPLAAVPVDSSSAIPVGVDVVILLDGDEDKVGECACVCVCVFVCVFCGFFPLRNKLKAPSHRFRGGVPQGELGGIITSKSVVAVACCAIAAEVDADADAELSVVP